MDESINLHKLALEKILFGENLLAVINKFKSLEGTQKLSRKISQELTFLKKISNDDNIKKEHLQCSNLTHFAALVETLGKTENCLNVNKIFNLNGRKITVDIVCDGGLSWIKVIARNPMSLNQISLGDSGYGVRSILDQADEYLQCAELYPCLFQTPQVIFEFANGVTSNVAAKLELRGITVIGTRICSLELDDEDLPVNSELTTKNTSHISKVNLDVSAMLAYCSSVTNGSCTKYKFSVPVLKQQAEWEAKRPVKPILDAFIKGKTLYCCETARDSFMEIVQTVGGPNEKIRAEELLKRVTVLPDDATAIETSDTNVNNEIFNHSQYTSDKSLPVGGKIRKRSLIIFTFGDRIQAVTVTANDGFVRAAKQKGINFVAFVHESRALTEQKEISKAVMVK